MNTRQAGSHLATAGFLAKGHPDRGTASSSHPQLRIFWILAPLLKVPYLRY
jgi:hypothetical protein